MDLNRGVGQIRPPSVNMLPLVSHRVVQDYAVTVSWFQRAAEQGYAPGQAALGFTYTKGRGGRQDDAEAVRWFRRAAEQGHARGQNHLGVSYRDGLGVAQDDAGAVFWFRRAAEQGRPPPDASFPAAEQKKNPREMPHRWSNTVENAERKEW